MSWKPNTPEQRIEYLERRVAELEAAIRTLQGRARLELAPQWQTLGDSTRPFRRDAAVQPLPTPAQFPIARPAAPAPHSWDVGTAVKAGFASGVMAALFSMPLAIAGSVTFPLGLGTIVVTPYFPGAVFCIATPLTFFAVSLHPASALNMLKEKIEPIIGMDLNGDNQIGEQEHVIRWESSTYDKKGQLSGIKNLEFRDIPDDVLMEFLAAIVGGLPLTGPSWKGESGALSQAKFTEVMRELERAGYVKNWRGNVGRKLTDEGKITLRCLISPDPEVKQRG